MKQTIATLLITILFTTAVAVTWADEKKDHVCFRTLDSNKDGMVTFQEFEKIYGNDEKTFNQADVDKDSKLTHEEYHNMLGHGSS